MQTYTENTLKLPDGVEIRYTDSGAPDTTDYTTLVGFHGTGFNSYQMVGLHEHAHKYNMRTVLCNRRDYHGSTPYSDAELEELYAGDQRFQDRLALKVAWILEHFVRHEHTPRVSADRAAGGLILMGWSSGNVTTLALFGCPEAIPRQLYETLEPHLRSLVLYDPPVQALGYPHPGPVGAYDVFTDPECTTREQIFDRFVPWVSSYYKHPDIASGILSGLKCTEKQTVNKWTDEEKAKYCDKEAACRSFPPGDPTTRAAMLRAQTHRALFDAALRASHFPNVSVLHICAEESPDICISAYLELSRLHSAAAIQRGSAGRRIKFTLVPHQNHFVRIALVVRAAVPHG
ncbi:hypothetical protein GGX14DRAFT_453255 [Mycena pura]|uniref:AB hydrolase-1 domain-containing protein n=1 Tax=Mycena pura TaxID=153505 RepID=A0AAD6YEM4_9AGAR|nr:hypothetical protein GGX14DRAFT_453255 [Mycena pura]